MVDKKEAKIFASLSKNGNGGTLSLEDYGSTALCIFKNFKVVWERTHDDCTKYGVEYESQFYSNVEAIDIKKAVA